MNVQNTIVVNSNLTAIDQNLSVRYNSDTDKIQVKFNGVWVDALYAWIQSKEVWIAGITNGFTAKVMDQNNGSGYSMNYYTDYMQLVLSRPRYTWIIVRLCCTNIIDLTNLSTVELLYDLDGIGITKITLGTSALENPNTYEISQEINRNGTGTVTKGSITLDISNLSGKKYIFVEVVTPNSGESGSSTVIANFRIRRIIAYK